MHLKTDIDAAFSDLEKTFCSSVQDGCSFMLKEANDAFHNILEKTVYNAENLEALIKRSLSELKMSIINNLPRESTIIAQRRLKMPKMSIINNLQKSKLGTGKIKLEIPKTEPYDATIDLIEMRRHKKSKKEFLCQQCSYVTMRRDHLVRHVKNVHLKLKDIVCKECDDAFSENYELNRHIRKWHPNSSINEKICPKSGFVNKQGLIKATSPDFNDLDSIESGKERIDNQQNSLRSYASPESTISNNYVQSAHTQPNSSQNEVIEIQCLPFLQNSCTEDDVPEFFDNQMDVPI